MISSCLLSFNYNTLKTKVKSILFAIIFYFTFLVKRITMKVIRNEEVFAMTQRYENIMVAVDGSKEADLAFIKGVQSALRNQAKLTIAHVIDTRALQSISTFDAEVYEELQVEAQELMAEYEKRARDAGLKDIQVVIEMGNPKTLLAKTIPDQEHVDLILVGATGLNAFERLLVGSSSEYILRHTSVDLLVVRDKDKTL
ncbi:universal stress family protein [Streptococcus infantis ATCC 700779]|uniref:Universal stress family protein n=3 Tax=Streptococcus TaxID=1301 RepID=E8JZ07_9STRE|nr:universal stress family protein [Streptococcus infantis ATCC 700779]